MLLRFTTIRDVAPQLAGHADRFKTAEAFDAACRAVWKAAEGHAQGASIRKEEADAIMDRAVESEP